MKPYSSKKEELSVYEDCILWGNRVVIPPKGRKAVLQELHEGHPGMTRMKALARMYVWWPGSDKDIEDSVSLCSDCQINQSAPPSAPLHPWIFPRGLKSSHTLRGFGILQNDTLNFYEISVGALCICIGA